MRSRSLKTKQYQKETSNVKKCIYSMTNNKNSCHQLEITMTQASGRTYMHCHESL